MRPEGITITEDNGEICVCNKTGGPGSILFRNDLPWCSHKDPGIEYLLSGECARLPGYARLLFWHARTETMSMRLRMSYSRRIRDSIRLAEVLANELDREI